MASSVPRLHSFRQVHKFFSCCRINCQNARMFVCKTNLKEDNCGPVHTSEAPTPSPKITSISGAKNKPKLVPSCLDHDNLTLPIMLMHEVACFKSCNRGALRLGEAWARPGEAWARPCITSITSIIG